ncbi:hypothetical protein [Geoglobus ahangari]
MGLEVELPKEIEVSVKRDRILELLVKRKIEHEIVKEIKEELFLAMLFDELLVDSELTDEDVERMEREIKEGIMERLKWK